MLPLVVISEVEAKRHHPELGYFARQSLRFLDDLRVKHGRLDQPLPLTDQGGTLHVELNHADPELLPHGFRADTNDARILAVALNLAAEGRDVTLVTKDMPLRVKAAAVGLAADEYRHGTATDPTWTGLMELGVTSETFRRCTGESRSSSTAPATCRSTPASCCSRPTARRSAGSVRTSPSGWSAATGRRSACVAARPSSASRSTFCSTRPIGIVSLGGRAGTGKSALALCAGLELVMERRKHKKVVVFRPLYAVGGQELGYLPGNEADKMAPWAQAVFDTLGGLVHDNVMEEVAARGMLEVLPLTHIRGRSLHDAFVIVDEAQSLERGVLLTVLSRIGTGSRVVLTHDVAQRDNLRVGRHDGVAAVIEALKGHPLFAHVTLTRSERSPIAEVVTDLLEDLPFA